MFLCTGLGFKANSLLKGAKEAPTSERRLLQMSERIHRHIFTEGLSTLQQNTAPSTWQV